MNTTTLQIPIDQTLKVQAYAEAVAQGFSSLQEMVRVLLKKIAAKQLSVAFLNSGEQFPAEILTDAQSKVIEKKYYEAMDAINNGVEGKDYFTAHSVEEMMQQLNS